MRILKRCAQKLHDEIRDLATQPIKHDPLNPLREQFMQRDLLRLTQRIEKSQPQELSSGQTSLFDPGPEPMDTLTKDNFWNQMMDLYPGEMGVFCKWIDEYKERVDWLDLFSAPNPKLSIKYHEIPVAMQFGIFMQFAVEKSDHPAEVVAVVIGRNEAFRRSIAAWFMRAHEGKWIC